MEIIEIKKEIKDNFNFFVLNTNINCSLPDIPTIYHTSLNKYDIGIIFGNKTNNLNIPIINVDNQINKIYHINYYKGNNQLSYTFMIIDLNQYINIQLSNIIKILNKKNIHNSHVYFILQTKTLISIEKCYNIIFNNIINKLKYFGNCDINFIIDVKDYHGTVNGIYKNGFINTTINIIMIGPSIKLQKKEVAAFLIKNDKINISSFLYNKNDGFIIIKMQNNLIQLKCINYNQQIINKFITFKLIKFLNNCDINNQKIFYTYAKYDSDYDCLGIYYKSLGKKKLDRQIKEFRFITYIKKCLHQEFNKV